MSAKQDEDILAAIFAEMKLQPASSRPAGPKKSPPKRKSPPAKKPALKVTIPAKGKKSKSPEPDSPAYVPTSPVFEEKDEEDELEAAIKKAKKPKEKSPVPVRAGFKVSTRKKPEREEPASYDELWRSIKESGSKPKKSWADRSEEKDASKKELADIWQEYDRVTGKDQPEETKPTRTFPRFPIFTGGALKQLSELLRTPFKEWELEVSFGIHVPDPRGGSRFISGVPSRTEFFDLKNYLDNLPNVTSKMYNTVVEIMNDKKANPENVRKITDLDISETIYQKKIRDWRNVLDIHAWGVRVAKSKEVAINAGSDFDEEKFEPNLIRRIKRYSYTPVSSESPFHNLRFDLSVVKEERKAEYGPDGTISKEAFSMDKYEVEIERVGRIDVAAVITNATEMVYSRLQNQSDAGLVMSQSEKKFVIDAHNRLFSKDIERMRLKIKPGRLFKDYWSKPINLKIIDLLDHDYPAVLVKFDGERRPLFIHDNGTYLVAPPFNIWKVGRGDNENSGTLIDGEYMRSEDGLTQSYSSFDLLFSKGEDFRQSDFYERVETLRKIPARISVGEYSVKKMYDSGNLYQDIRDAFDYFEEHLDTCDGLILQNKGIYRSRDKRRPEAYKWKPSNMTTIDFLLRLEDEELVPYVGFENGVVRFAGSQNYPVKTPVVTSDLDENVDGLIVECKWNADDQVFEAFRLRSDKERPQYSTVASNVWDDIMDPISRPTLEGYTLQVMRKFHNRIKFDILKSTFREGDVIIDIGSGRGGDLSKWKQIGLSQVLCVEPNEENLTELLKRWEEMPADQRPAIKVMRDEDGTPLGAEELEKKHIGMKPENINGIVSFFSLTFFFQDREKYNKLLDFIDNNLSVRGHFVGIVMDGNRTRDLLEKTRMEKEIPEEDGSYYNTKAFRIDQTSEYTSSGIGDEISITIKDTSSMVKEQDEWLFYFPTFEADLKKRGIHLLRKTEFLDEGRIYDKLPGPSQIFSGLNRSFVFIRKAKKEKKKDIETLKPEEKIPVELPISDDDVEEFARLGVEKSTSNLLHALYRATDEKYELMEKQSEREEYMIEERKTLAEELTPASFAKLKLKLDIDDFKEKLSDDSEWFPLSMLPYIDVTSDYDVFLLNNRGTPSKRSLSRNKKFAIVLYSKDGIHYDIVLDSDESAFFSSKSALVKHLKSQL